MAKLQQRPEQYTTGMFPPIVLNVTVRLFLSEGHHDAAVVPCAEIDRVLEPEVFGEGELEDGVAV
jgi:hypothetical protein